ncbi:MAG: SUMF1/EgtB/PvdO family nonheme iron enzyme [Thermoguttaceae bacterium]|nr:SUMF1/EgtB/PvdO family nonheme iron enzyme [Thermoguttaceae bacterium]
MKRFLILFLMMTITLIGCEESKPKPSVPAVPEQPAQAQSAVEKQTLQPVPPSIEEIETKLSEIQDKLQSTEDLLIKRTAERDTVKNELGQIIRRSNKTPKEIKAELAKVKSDLDSQQWFQEIRSAWSKLVALERDVVVFTRQEDRLNRSRIQLEQSLETLKRIEENNSVYIAGEDPELDRLIAEGDVIVQDGEWEKLTTGEKTEIALEVNKIMTETIESSVSKIPGLELESVKELSPLPDMTEKVQTPDKPAEKSLLTRVKNDCNRIVDRANKEFEEYLEDKQLESACRCRLEAVKEVENILTSASDNFDQDFFRVYLDALVVCQNDTLLELSKPYLQALSRCVKDLETKDPDWKTIAESLEGLLRIKPVLPDSEVETQLKIIRSHFEYLLKQNDRDAQVMQERLRTAIVEMGLYVGEQFTSRHYDRSVRLLEEKKYKEAAEEIRLALEKCPDNKTYIAHKKAIEKAVENEEKNSHFNKSVEFLEKKQFKEALDEIQILLEKYPDNEKFLAQKDLIDRIAKIDEADGHYDQSVIFLKKKQFEEAFKEIELAIGLFPGHDKYANQKHLIEQAAADKHYSQSVTLFENKQYNEALDDIKAAIDIFPENEKYTKQKQLIEQTVIEEEANRHYNQSVKFLENKQYQEALKEIGEALSITPDNEKFADHKKWIEKTVKNEEADKHFKQVAGLLERKLYSEALAETISALEIYPENNDYRKQKEELEKMLPKAGDRKAFTVDGVEFAFRWCPCGKFMMGDPGLLTLDAPNARFLDRKAHKVRLTEGFWLLETEVTQEMWKAVMGLNQDEQKKLSGRSYDYGIGDSYPIYYVNWEESWEFCRKLSAKLGKRVKLPTEAQWEYACRAGSTDDYAGDPDAMAWYEKNSDEETHAVGQKKPNAWGLLDMYGNVYEWCSDWYDEDYYTNSPEIDPENQTSSPLRVTRGGSWMGPAEKCKSSFRSNQIPDSRLSDVGFRVLIVPGEGE